MRLQKQYLITEISLEYWPSGADSVLLSINDSSIDILDQVFTVESHKYSHGHLYFYELKLNAHGIYYDNCIELKFEEFIRNKKSNKFKLKDSGIIVVRKKGN